MPPVRAPEAAGVGAGVAAPPAAFLLLLLLELHAAATTSSAASPAPAASRNDLSLTPTPCHTPRSLARPCRGACGVSCQPEGSIYRSHRHRRQSPASLPARTPASG